MIALGQGRWAKDLALPPGDYEYCLVVDGQWKPDPQATETIPNPFGGVNSVRKVGNGGWCAQTARITGERAQNSASPAADEIRLRLEDNHHQ